MIFTLPWGQSCRAVCLLPGSSRCVCGSPGAVSECASYCEYSGSRCDAPYPGFGILGVGRGGYRDLLRYRREKAGTGVVGVFCAFCPCCAVESDGEVGKHRVEGVCHGYIVCCGCRCVAVVLYREGVCHSAVLCDYRRLDALVYRKVRLCFCSHCGRGSHRATGAVS